MARAGDSGAFVWNGNVMERLLPPVGQTVYGAEAMNDSGTLVGFGGPTGGFRWNAGSYLSLGLLPGDAYAAATAINGFGLIVGYAGTNSGAHPRLWVGTSPQALSLPESATNGAVFGINDLGDAVGWYLTPEFNRRPFIWSPSLGARSLPLPPGAADAPATTINDAGIITGYADGQPVIWRKTSSGVYESMLVAPLITDGSGWSGLALWAINEAGQIAGTGRLNGARRGFILSPKPTLNLALRTDADRSGTTEFEGPADATVPGQPFYFWLNDDHDATGGDVENGPVDSADDRILNPVLVNGSDESANAAVVRDLEDFARLAFKLTPDLKVALEAGAKLRLEAAGAGTIHLFSTPSAGEETRYLTDEPFAVSLISDVVTDVALLSANDSAGTTRWENIETHIKPADWESGRLRFIWEGVTPGACVLTLKLSQSDGTEIISNPVHLSLRPVRDYFENVHALPTDGFPPPYDTNGQSPVMSWGLTHPQAAGPADQQNVDLVWVHGWRLPKWNRQNWAEMMFKRLWHAGYNGRFHAFTWPTYSADEEPKTDGFLSFDRSEFRAWKSGTALESYLRYLRNGHSGARLTLVAHSMGNIVTGEALRRGAPADLQIMMQAAVSAGCYDTRAVLEETKLLDHERKNPTPDFDVELGYRRFLANITVPTINYHNAEDFALQSGKKAGVQVNWFAHQGDKPYDPNGRGTYEFYENLAGFYSGKKGLRQIVDVHESLAFLARSRTRAVGAEPLTGYTSTGSPIGPLINRLDLHAAPFRFSDDSIEHSAQFNRPIQRQLIGFYASIIDNVSPGTAP